MSGTDTCAAWLYPAAHDGTFAVIVMAHGLTGTRRDRCRDQTVAVPGPPESAYRSAPSVQAAIEAAAAASDHLPAVGQPHEAAFINAPGAEAGWRHVVAIGEDSRWRNRASTG